jgi:hypothetical protein
MKKPLLFPLFNIENLSPSGWKSCICVLLFLFSFEKSYAQLPLQNITCTGCSTTASTGYATASAAATGTGAGTTTYNLAPNSTIKQCATVTSDANGTVGIINAIQTSQPSGNTICTSNTAATRKGSLYLASGTNCTGSEIQSFRKGANSGTFNNEYVGLTPNTNYIFVFTTTVDGSCSAYSTSSIRFYGGVVPQFTFNCGTASTTGTFIADGSSHSGTLIVPITGATAGSATFNVSGTGFTGTLTTTLTAGQTSVTILINYDGSGSAGSRTLTVTSPMGGGLCSKSVTVTGNTAPVITSAASANFAENGLGIAYTTTATDVDAGQTKTYSLETGGVDNGKFTINASTGEVSFIASPDFEIPTDVGGNNVYDIKVKVCDNGTPVLCAIKDVAITVTNVVECNAGTTAPTLSATTKSNVCPTTTADISSLVSSTCPVGSSLEWHNVSTGFAAANKIANPASVLAGTYYPVCFDATNTCYSPAPATGVTVSITTCTTCNATVAPLLSASTTTNVCPSTIAYLNLITASNMPSGTTLSWHISPTATAANEISPGVLGFNATYYAAFKGTNGGSVCFGPTTPINVTQTTCLSITQPATQTGFQSVNKSGTVSADVTPTGGVGTITYSNGSADPACIAPSGATALPLSSNLIINANGSYSYTTPPAVGTYYFCVKVCDSATPTPDCKIAIYKVVVLPPPCNVGTTAPKIN